VFVYKISNSMLSLAFPSVSVLYLATRHENPVGCGGVS